MKRLAYRTALASLLTANGVCLAVLFPQAVRTQPDGALFEAIAAVCFLYAGAVALVYACRAAWHVGRADVCRFVHRRQRPSTGRAAKQQHAAAMAAVAAEPMQSQHIDDTAVMPAQTGPTWGFGPTTPVVDALPELWTAPTGRHAGVSDELREFDYEPAGVAR